MNRKDTVAWCALLVIIAILGVLLGHGFWPVTVIEAVKPEPENPWTFGWDALVAIGTIGLGAVTAWLAYRTSQMAHDAKLEREQADSHHRQSLSPILIITDGSELEVRRRDNDPQKLTLHLRASMQNIGFGPATNIVVKLSHPTQRITEILSAGSLETGESRSASIYVRADLPQPLTLWTYTDARIELRYHNAFNEWFASKYKLIQYEEGNQQRLKLAQLPLDFTNTVQSKTPAQHEADWTDVVLVSTDLTHQAPPEVQT